VKKDAGEGRGYFSKLSEGVAFGFVWWAICSYISSKEVRSVPEVEEMLEGSFFLIFVGKNEKGKTLEVKILRLGGRQKVTFPQVRIEEGHKKRVDSCPLGIADTFYENGRVKKNCRCQVCDVVFSATRE